jgi:Rieske Fe-S protein
VPEADVPEDGALVFREARVAVVREGGEPYALRLVCTHLGCTLSVGPRDIECPCHGSRFDRSGKVLQGPATRGLDRLRVERRGDRLVILS